MRLGLFSLVCLVVANMVGAGVYTSSGFALGDVKSKWLVLLAWAFAGTIALLGAICYGRLARWITASGGEYLFLSRAVHPFAGFMAGWISLTAGFSGAIAYSALTFQAYIPKGTWIDELPASVIPLALILFFGEVHLRGLQLGARLQNGLVGIKLAFLIAFTAFGLYVVVPSMDQDVGSAGPVVEATVGDLEVADSSGEAIPGDHVSGEVMAASTGFPFGAFATSLMWISFSYAGYNAAVYVAGASEDGATVARSMWLATLAVTAIYLLLNAVILFSSPAEALNYKPNVLEIAASSLGGLWLSKVMSFVILLSLATSVSAMLQIGPHVYAQMARDGLLPRFLAVPEGSIPRSATVLQTAFAMFLTVYADLQSLLDFLGFLLTLSSAAAVAILLLPQIRKQENSSGLVRGILIPGAFVIASLVISALSLSYRLSSDPKGLRDALMVVPAGAFAYIFFRRFSQFKGIAGPPPL